ncbi:MAG: hypothetical protein H6724_10305 [Sandaracinus sp.]|nr:hypothetical protein [Sandaracinus sp.]
MKLVERFLRELARAWDRDERPTLQVIGSTALMLQTDFVRATKDSDVLRTLSIDGAVGERLLDLAGPGSTLAKRWSLYLEIVPNGLPFLPRVPSWHPVSLGDAPSTLTVEALDVVDVVVSKLKRFSANDRSDIEAMIERGFVPHDRLVDRFVAAVESFEGDARAADLPAYVENLHEIERDAFGVEETEIDLPAWI